jgi:hypothetical protein
VPYDGPIIKRAAPTAEDYITIKAGKSVEGEFMVSDGYNTSLPGTYNVKLKNPVPDVVPKSAKLRTAMKAGAHVRKPVPIKSATSFKVEKGPGKRLTFTSILIRTHPLTIFGMDRQIAEASQRQNPTTQSKMRTVTSTTPEARKIISCYRGRS